ncbi:TetR/AcrR family transcriptional regulator [Adhaeribacter aquaticus]|uniref:TetR/AcrR family transcriptional regulator n=1 Tax=Adhaeribacter aquaticus TaxID=299567 RepID=UPI0003F723E6|nr:helix-turn-helix domain-containing protein [Adhaeribacter aquaticus]
MKSDANFEMVKENIVKASKEVFRRYGYTKVNMDDISKASGKGRSTIYHYFGNKTEVFEAFAITEFTGIIQLAKEKINPKASLAENLLAYNLVKLKRLKVLTMEYANIMKDLNEQEQLVFTLNRLLLQEEFEAVNGIFTLGIEKGEIAKLHQEDKKFLVETLVIAFRSFEQEIILFNGMGGLENRLKWLVDILIKGLK